MINLNDITLVPKKKSFVMYAKQLTTNIRKNPTYTEYECSEKVFKQILVDKIGVMLCEQKNIADLEQLIVKRIELLSNLDETSISSSHIRSQIEDGEKYIKELRKDKKINVYSYMDQIDQDSGEYMSLMLYDFSEWYIK